MDIASPHFLVMNTNELQHLTVRRNEFVIYLPSGLAKHCDGGQANERIHWLSYYTWPSVETYCHDIAPCGIALNTVALVSIELVRELVIKRECEPQWIAGHLTLSSSYLAFELQIMPRPQ